MKWSRAAGGGRIWRWRPHDRRRGAAAWRDRSRDRSGFAACFADGRAQAQVEHAIEAMVAQRVFGIALGYEDLIDHDHLRQDPVLATLAGKLTAKRQGWAPLAGKSTSNRLEHAPSEPARYHKIGHDDAAIERLLADLFLEAHKTPPREIILDLDATDDPVPGAKPTPSITSSTSPATTAWSAPSAKTWPRPRCRAWLRADRRAASPTSPGTRSTVVADSAGGR